MNLLETLEMATPRPEKVSLNVNISNLTDAQANQFKMLFGWMNRLGGVGASRSLKVFCDGDGNFRPIIRVNGDDVKADDRDDENLHFGFD